MSNPKVILSGFADEGPVSKRAEEQLTMMRALGLSYYTIRFMDLGNGVKNVMQLTDEEVQRLQGLHKELDIQISSIGSPLGKVKLVDQEDGTQNRYVPFEQYLKEDVQRAIDLAHAFDTKLLRGFSYYHPHGEDPWKYLDQAAEHLGQIAEKCASEGILYGMEVEADLIGGDGDTLAALYEKVNNPSLCIIPDVGNMEYKGHSPDSAYEHYVKMKPGVGWIHIKGFNNPPNQALLDAAEKRGLTRFIPVDRGDSGHEQVLRDFRTLIPTIEKRLKPLGVPGVFMDLEPHVKGGGQFGGVSGVDGFGVAFRSLCRLLDYLEYDYDLTGYEDISNPKS
ncbi:MAG: TIM barrel protein [bacterium]|nr:TIM barrel protein [bacterium]